MPASYFDQLTAGTPTRVWVNRLLVGGGQPGITRDGYANRVPICRASRNAYDWRCVESLIPPDWNPAVMLFPIAT